MQLMYDIIINVMRMTSAKLCEKYRFFFDYRRQRIDKSRVSGMRKVCLRKSRKF